MCPPATCHTQPAVNSSAETYPKPISGHSLVPSWKWCPTKTLGDTDQCERAGLKVPPCEHIIGHFGDDFYRLHSPPNSVIALKEKRKNTTIAYKTKLAHVCPVCQTWVAMNHKSTGLMGYCLMAHSSHITLRQPH